MSLQSFCRPLDLSNIENPTQFQFLMAEFRSWTALGWVVFMAMMTSVALSAAIVFSDPTYHWLLRALA